MNFHNWVQRGVILWIVKKSRIIKSTESVRSIYFYNSTMWSRQIRVTEDIIFSKYTLTRKTYTPGKMMSKVAVSLLKSWVLKREVFPVVNIKHYWWKNEEIIRLYKIRSWRMLRQESFYVLFYLFIKTRWDVSFELFTRTIRACNNAISVTVMAFKIIIHWKSYVHRLISSKWIDNSKLDTCIKSNFIKNEILTVLLLIISWRQHIILLNNYYSMLTISGNHLPLIYNIDYNTPEFFTSIR
jgi:hypothetical protein